MMNHSALSSLDGVDLDAFFASSIPRMDKGTFPWPAGRTTFDEKADFLRGLIAELMGHPTSFCHQVTLFGDPVHLIFSYRKGPVLRRVLALFKPDRSGSLAHVYNPSLIADRDAFFRANGITEIAGMVTPASPIQTLLETHNGAQAFDEKAASVGEGVLHHFRQTLT